MSRRRSPNAELTYIGKTRGRHGSRGFLRPSGRRWVFSSNRGCLPAVTFGSPSWSASVLALAGILLILFDAAWDTPVSLIWSPKEGFRDEEDRLARGWRSGLETTWELTKVILPVTLVVSVLKYTPVIEWMVKGLTPLMGWIGLPGEAAVPLALGNLLNLYAAIGAILTMDLTVKQVLILAVMLSFLPQPAGGNRPLPPGGAQSLPGGLGPYRTGGDLGPVDSHPVERRRGTGVLRMGGRR